MGESISSGNSIFDFDGLVLENTGNINFALATLSGIETLVFSSGTSTATFTGGQVGGAGDIGLVAGNTASLDTIVVNGAAINLSAMVFQSWAVSDVVSLNGTAGTDTVTGSVQRDTIRGGAQADKLNGNGGNDTFEIAGTEGIGDIVEGGDGTDILQFIGAGIVTLDGFNAGTSSIERVNGNGEELRGTSAGRRLQFLRSHLEVGLQDRRWPRRRRHDHRHCILRRSGGGTNNDTIRGDDGNDRLTGGNGRDLLTGGANAVIFDFNTFGESVVGANRDQILDFSRAQADRIDLSTIDAKTGIDGNQKFTFIGTQAFHGVKGELRFKDLGANGVVQGDVNGNGTADFEIRVIVGTMLAADFLL